MVIGVSFEFPEYLLQIQISAYLRFYLDPESLIVEYNKNINQDFIWKEKSVNFVPVASYFPQIPVSL